MTPEQTETLAIIHAIDASWGRTTRPCETCGGDGAHSVREGHGESSGWSRPCPDCNGRGYQWREWLQCERCRYDRRRDDPRYTCAECGKSHRIPDTEGLAVIAEAVSSVFWYSQERGHVYRLGGDLIADNNYIRVTCLEYMSWLWIWNNRHNQPWCSQLEAHVANFQQQPPEGDELLGLVKGLLREAKIDVDLSLEYDGECHAVLLSCGERIGPSASADTELVALLSAVKAAKIGGE